MDIIPRREWDARRPKRDPTKVKPAKRKYFVVHHSGGPATQTVRAIQDWCMNDPPHGRGFNDIDYNFLVRATTGEIYEGRGWDVQGSHTLGHNTDGAGICVIGTNEIGAAAKRAVRWLYDEYNRRCDKTLKIRGHGQLDSTECPEEVISAWLADGMPAPGGRTTFLPEEDDMATISQNDFNERMDAWWNARMSPAAGDNPQRNALRVAPWQQLVGSSGKTTHNVLFGEMLNLLRAAAHTSDIESALASQMLRGLTPAQIAAAVQGAVPPEEMKAVNDELNSRIPT